MRDKLLCFIQARETARHCRDLDMPFTEDEIIRDYRFCNIDREHDRVTIAVDKLVRQRRPLLSKSDMVMNLAVARIFNEPRTLEAVLLYRSSAQLRASLVELKKQDPEKSPFRGAYFTFPVGSANKGVSSIEYFIDRFAALAEIKVEFNSCDSLQDVANVMEQVAGFGPFYRNQICTDLRYTEHFKDADDWETYLECGPGTIRGIRRYHEAHPYGPRRLPMGKIIQALFEVREDLVTEFDCFRDPNNVANLFCEFDKYLRVASGQQVALRKYRKSST